MELHLTDKVAVVTGASKGIGFAIASAFAAEGANVVAASRNIDTLTHLTDRFSVLPVAVDLRSPHGPTKLIEQALTTFGHVDILVNNVGGASPHPEGFLSTTDEDWYYMFELNLMSTVRACQATLPVMIERGKGAIVNISSVNARQSSPMVVDYGAMKAAVTNLSKILSEEFGPKGIRVNTISPGPVHTPFWFEHGGMVDKLSQAMGADRETVIRQIPQLMGLTLGRMLEPDEVVAAVLLLCSEHAAMVTGADWVVDGGMMKTT